MVTRCALSNQPDPLAVTPEGDGRGPWARAWPRIPEVDYVTYVALAVGGDALYVGQSRRPRERLRDHAKNRWWHDVALVLLFPAVSEADARMGELGLAEQLRPRHSSIARGERRRLRRLLEAEYDGHGL